MADSLLDTPSMGQSRVLNVPTSATPTQLCGDNPRRLAIIINADAVLTITISLNSSNPGKVAIVIPPNTQPFKMCSCEFGDIVVREMYCYSTGAVTVNAIEVEDIP